MKLQELATPHQTKQAAKVFESYFGRAIDFDSVSKSQAANMLNRVRGLIREHRRQPEFHTSERNPSYLKLMMMEQALAGKVMELALPAGAPNPQAQAAAAAAISKIKDPKVQAAMKKSQAGQTLNPDEQQLIAAQAMMPQTEGRKRGLYNVLRESEIQQAQVVLAAQDMVDRMQKMIEEVTALQFKDLPALVDQIKNQVGVDQSLQFNQDATSALGGLVQNLQGSKQQLEQALGVVTGQAPTVPGDDMGMGNDLGGEPPMGDMGDDLGGEPPMGDIELDAEIEPEDDKPAVSLGRGRR